MDGQKDEKIVSLSWQAIPRNASRSNEVCLKFSHISPDCLFQWAMLTHGQSKVKGTITSIADIPSNAIPMFTVLMYYITCITPPPLAWYGTLSELFRVHKLLQQPQGNKLLYKEKSSSNIDHVQSTKQSCKETVTIFSVIQLSLLSKPYAVKCSVSLVVTPCYE